MQARFYGACPLSIGSTISVSRWLISVANRIVLLEFCDGAGVRWIGPEYPLDLGNAETMEVQERTLILTVRAATVDTIESTTKLELDHCDQQD